LRNVDDFCDAVRKLQKQSEEFDFKGAAFRLKINFLKQAFLDALATLATLAAMFESIDHDFLELRAQVTADNEPPQLSPSASDPTVSDENHLLTAIAGLFPDAAMSATIWQRLMIDLDQLNPDWDATMIAESLAQQNSRYSDFFVEYPEYGRKLGNKIRLLLYASSPARYRALTTISSRQVFDLWRRQRELQ
jgi:hypothetical protein